MKMLSLSSKEQKQYTNHAYRLALPFLDFYKSALHTRHVRYTPLMSIITWIDGPAWAGSRPAARKPRGRNAPTITEVVVMRKRATEIAKLM